MKRILTIFLALAFIMNADAFDRKKYNFNCGWKLKIGDVPSAMQTSYDDSDWKAVTLPNAFNEDEAFKLDIVDLTDTVVWYRKHFNVDEMTGRKFFIEFEGVRQAADFYINGHHLGLHENGVMAVGFDLTPHIISGENVIAVRVDNDWKYREKSSNARFQWNDKNFNANYGGIPKNVYLHVTSEVYQTLPLYSNLQTTGVYLYGTDYDIPSKKMILNAESQVRNDSEMNVKLGMKSRFMMQRERLSKLSKAKRFLWEQVRLLWSGHPPRSPVYISGVGDMDICIWSRLF